MIKVIDYSQYNTYSINNIHVGDVVTTKEIGTKVVCAVGIRNIWVFLDKDKVILNEKEVFTEKLNNLIKLPSMDILYAGKVYLESRVVAITKEDILETKESKRFFGTNKPVACRGYTENFPLFKGIVSEGFYLGDTVHIPKEFKCKQKSALIVAIGKNYIYIESEKQIEGEYSTTQNKKLKECLDENSADYSDIKYYIPEKLESYVYSFYKSKYNIERFIPYTTEKVEKVDIVKKVINKALFLNNKSIIPEIKFKIEEKNVSKFVKVREGITIHNLDSSKTYKVKKENLYTYTLDDGRVLSKGFFDEILQIEDYIEPIKKETKVYYNVVLLKPEKTYPELEENTIYTVTDHPSNNDMYYSEELKIYIPKRYFQDFGTSTISVFVEETTLLKYKTGSDMIFSSHKYCKGSYFIEELNKWIPKKLFKVAY